MRTSEDLDTNPHPKETGIKNNKIMGLDISAYKNIRELDCVFDADGDPINPETREPIDGEWFQACVNSDFPGRNNDIKDRAIYTYADCVVFRAGSYIGYNGWREDLARLAGYPKAECERYGTIYQRHDAGAFKSESGPFWELICFSDCEGIIGSETCAKLAKDFADYQEKADLEADGFFVEKYNEWRKAFELAANSGAVRFH